VVVGAERMDANALASFASLLAPYGFRREAILPAYGLAEATLAVTGLPVDEGWRSIALQPSSVRFGEAIATSAIVEAGEAVVGCGRPLRDVVVAVGNGERVLPDGYVGEIMVRGRSVGAGYVRASGDEPASAFQGDVLRTGDAGFLLDGQLFVLGRIGDGLKVRGLLVLAEQLEVALAAAGLPRARSTVLLGMHEGAPTAVVVAEEVDGVACLTAAVLPRFVGGAVIVVANVPRGAIPRTSSGKPRRRKLWRAFVNGSLDDAIVHASAVQALSTGG
jgi:acyl-CoA synthetase (AMP-forming)/AMP-acid ligase II